MIYKLVNKKFFKQDFFYTLIFFFWIILHITYLVQFDDYYDDWNFFFTVDPTITNNQTWQRHYFGDRGDGILKEAYPWNFTYFTKYFLKVFGYTVETTHIFILIFTVFSYLIFFKLVNLIFKNFKFKILALLLFTTNLFLIRELNSFRPHSLVLMLSFLSNYYFIKIFILKKKKFIHSVSYLFFSLGMMSLWPHSVALLCGHLVFLFIITINKNYNFLNLLLPIVALLSYVLLNFKYIEYLLLENSFSYTPFDLKFFINFFFRSFFGSILFGAIMLLIFSFYLFNEFKVNFFYIIKNNLKKITTFQRNIKNFILINILTVYFSIILFSIFKESVIAGKYFLFLLPVIILWICLKIEEKKNIYIYNIIFIVTFINIFYYWSDIPIDRPPSREVLKILNNNNVKSIYTTESLVFNNYLSNYRYAKNNGLSINRIENLNVNIETNEYAIVCLNYPRAFYGENYLNLEDIKCLTYFQSEYNMIIKKIIIPDFIIFLLKKNS